MNRDEAIRQLKLLGYQNGDRVYIRCFGANINARKFDKLNYLEIEKQQRSGQNIYFVVNGQGHEDKDIKEGRTLFTDDDRPVSKEEKINQWRKAGMPEPTLMVDTGGKSIHSYWQLKDPIDIKLWSNLQERIIAAMEGDRVCKNLSRVMRLAGCNYINKEGKVLDRAKIVAASGQVYSYEELNEIVPSSEELGLKEKPEVETIKLPVPLYNCLTKDDRDLLDSGQLNGSRNASGTKLARNLIGTAQRLDYLGILYEGQPYQLFLEFCKRCPANDDWNEKEFQSIWKSAQKNNPTASLTDDALLNCAKAFHKNHSQQTSTSIAHGGNHATSSTWGDPKTGVAPQDRVDSTNARVSATVTQVDSNSKQDTVSIAETVTRVTDILNNGHKPFEEIHDLECLRKQTDLDTKAFDELVRVKRLEGLTTIQSERLTRLIETQTEKLDIKAVFPVWGNYLIHDAEVKNIEPMAIIHPLMAAVGSLFGKNAYLEIGSRKVHPSLYCAVVGESSGGKTRGIKVALSPLFEANDRAFELYQEEKTQHKQDLEDWEGQDPEERGEKPQPPVRRNFVFNIATMQKVQTALVSQSDNNGVLWTKDELEGLFKSFGQFSGGNSEDLEIILSLFDNHHLIVDRVDESKVVSGKAFLSIFGGIQPGVFSKLFDKYKDDKGVTGRFLFTKIESQRSQGINEGFCYLSEILPDFYQWCDTTFNQALGLSDEAFKWFSPLSAEIENERFSYPESSPERAWIGRLVDQILRLSIVLHTIDCYSDRSKNILIITKETLMRACILGNFYKNQFLSLRGEAVSTASPLSNILNAIWKKALNTPDGLTPREALACIKALRLMSKDESVSPTAYALHLFRELEATGKAKLEKEGRTYRLFSKEGGRRKKEEEKSEADPLPSSFNPLPSLTVVTPASNTDTASDTTVVTTQLQQHTQLHQLELIDNQINEEIEIDIGSEVITNTEFKKIPQGTEGLVFEVRSHNGKTVAQVRFDFNGRTIAEWFQLKHLTPLTKKKLLLVDTRVYSPSLKVEGTVTSINIGEIVITYDDGFVCSFETASDVYRTNDIISDFIA